MKQKYLFLDIDGVLNDHTQFPNGYCGIQYEKMQRLNYIVEKSGCKIVLISSWRYMIFNEAMCLAGFRNLLLISGASRETAKALIGYIDRDTNVSDPHNRSKLVDKWVYDVSRLFTEPHRDDCVILDDLDCGYADLDYFHVQTDPKVGLTEWEVDMVLAIFQNPANARSGAVRRLVRGEPRPDLEVPRSETERLG